MTLQSTYQAIVHEQHERVPRFETGNIATNIADHNPASGFDPHQAITAFERREKADTWEVTIRNTGTIELLSHSFSV